MALTPHRLALFLLLLLPLMLVFFRIGAEVCVGGVGLLYLFHCAKTRDWGWLRSPLAVLMLITWAWVVLVVSPLALDAGDSFKRALPWLRFPLFFFAVTRWVLKEPNDVRLFCRWLAALLLFVMADTLFQYIMGYDVLGRVSDTPDRLTGPFNGLKVGAYVAKLMFPPFAYLAWEALRAQRRGMALVCGASLLCGLAVILLSGERTAFANAALGMGVGCALAALYEKRLRLPLAGIMLAAALVGGALFATQPSVQRRAQAFAGHVQEFNAGPYGGVTRVSLALSGRHPFSGVGLGNYQTACEALVAQEPVAPKCEMHAHNPYFEWLVEAGIAGLLLFIAWVAWMCRQLARNFRHAPLAVAGGVACCFVFFFPLMSGPSTVSNWPGMLLWLCMAMAVALSQSASREART